jgi:membrane protein required for beta-lactamase induction
MRKVNRLNSMLRNIKLFSMMIIEDAVTIAGIFILLAIATIIYGLISLAFWSVVFTFIGAGISIF